MNDVDELLDAMEKRNADIEKALLKLIYSGCGFIAGLSLGMLIGWWV